MGITESLVLSERAHFFRPTPNPPLRPSSAPSFNAQNNTSSSVNRSFNGHFRSGFGIGFAPPSPPLSLLSQRAQNISAIRIGHATLSLAPRGSKMRPMLSPNSSASLLISESAAAASDLVCEEAHPYTSGGRQPHLSRGGRPKFCDAKLNLRSRGRRLPACLVDEVAAGLVTRCFRFSASSCHL